MNVAWSILPATEDDVPAIAALLRANELPDNDLVQTVGDFFVAKTGDTLIGAAGLERYEAHALLRSVAVAPLWRKQGVAGALVDAVVRHARSAGLRDVYLLTQAAPEYFARHGFAPIARESLPAPVLACAQVQRLCPASAKVMVRPL